MIPRIGAAVAATLLAASALSGAMPTQAATFAEETAFTKAAFDAARQAGRPILVHVTASWCTTCAQKPILAGLRAEPKFERLAVFNIDFDRQKPLVRDFGARIQSTLIVFKGGKEAGRSSGETKPAAIATLLNEAL